MRKIKKFLAPLLLSLACLSLEAQIVEMKHMCDIHPYITPETLVIFDIDNTLMETSQTLGSDQWFYHQFESYMNEGMVPAEALEKCLNEWHAIQFLTDVKVVEEGTAQIVKKLQDQGIKVMGLTTRGLDLSNCTEQQLERLDIDLTRTAPTQVDTFIINSHKGVLFHGGILFTMATHKGHAFFKFMDQLGIKPKSVLFVNDKAKHIQEIETACHERGIPFLGLRYSFLDEKVKNFNREIADVQFERFGTIISDQEALNLMLTPCEGCAH